MYKNILISKYEKKLNKLKTLQRKNTTDLEQVRILQQIYDIEIFLYDLKLLSGEYNA